jgi:hypothetical protein
VKLLAGSGIDNAIVGGEGGWPPSGPVEATLLAKKLIVVQHTHDLRGTFDGHADGTGALIGKMDLGVAYALVSVALQSFT